MDPLGLLLNCKYSKAYLTVTVTTMKTLFIFILNITNINIIGASLFLLSLYLSSFFAIYLKVPFSYISLGFVSLLRFVPANTTISKCKPLRPLSKLVRASQLRVCRPVLGCLYKSYVGINISLQGRMPPLFITNNLRLLHTIIINLNSIPPRGLCKPSQSSYNNSKFNLIYSNQPT
jgi:hypothetical protein